MPNKSIKARVSEKPMENSNKLICEKLQITNDINSFYVDIFEVFTRQKFGQVLDYVNILYKLDDLCLELKNEISECNIISTNNEYEALQIIEILSEYQALLNSRICLLKAVLKKLYDKSEAIGERYSFFAYNSDMRQLKAMEKQNELSGNTLQLYAVPFMRKYR